jgi:hypothetical protein
MGGRIGNKNGETSVKVIPDSGAIVITESWCDDYREVWDEQTITICRDIDGRVIVKIDGFGTYAHLVLD